MKCKLSDIAVVTMGQSPKGDTYNKNGDGMPFLQGNRTFGDRYPTFDTWFLIGSKFTDMIHEGKLTEDRMEDLGGILRGRLPGRESDDQIIIYSIGGMPIEDVAWGRTVYDNAVEKGIGTKLKLWDKPYLY